MAPPGGHMFYIGLYREIVKNLLVWNHKAWSHDILYVTPPSGLLPILFKLYPLGQKCTCPGGQMFYIGFYRENVKRNFMSETTWPRALIFGT